MKELEKVALRVRDQMNTEMWSMIFHNSYLVDNKDKTNKLWNSVASRVGIIGARIKGQANKKTK